MNADRQRSALNGYKPFSYGDLIEQKKVIFHETVEEFTEADYPYPHIIFCTQSDPLKGTFSELLKV